MLNTLIEILETGTIEINSTGERVTLHSHTPKGQGLFLQQMYDLVKPSKSLEVGLAYGISTLFILEKCRQYNSAEKCHVIIEPFPWGNTALYNITKEGLEKYIDIRNELSDKVIPSMYLNNDRIQFAYVDTTKVFDTVLQDFYFIDKILDVGGIIIIDDASTGGINMVIRFISTLPHYKAVGKFDQQQSGKLYSIGERIFEAALTLVPFKSRFLKTYSFKTNRQLDIDYRCIAFRKINADERNWDWEAPF
jgi:predicted O-methyltransferase YrrM